MCSRKKIAKMPKSQNHLVFFLRCRKTYILNNGYFDFSPGVRRSGSWGSYLGNLIFFTRAWLVFILDN